MAIKAAMIPPQLLYPEPGATNVAAGNFTMVTIFVTSLTLNAGAQVITLPSPGPTPSPLPSPMASPVGGAQFEQGEAVPALQAHTTYREGSAWTGRRLQHADGSRLFYHAVA
jgi:hypothetical protein